MLSVDPSSPFTEGALLGDRIRLAEHFLDEGVYIRSMASRGALGGLSEATLQAVLLMDASGKDDVLVETVGVGQAEVDIIDHADTVVLVLMPGSGDSVQALKAGVMEIPDVIVVNKANHPLTDTMVREIRGVLALGPVTDWKVPILKTEAAEGKGVEELAAAIDSHHEHIKQAGTLEERRRRNLRNEVLGLAAVRLRRELERSLEGDASRAGAARAGRAPRGRPGQRGGGAAARPRERALAAAACSIARAACASPAGSARAPARPPSRTPPSTITVSALRRLGERPRDQEPDRQQHQRAHPVVGAHARQRLRAGCARPSRCSTTRRRARTRRPCATASDEHDRDRRRRAERDEERRATPRAPGTPRASDDAVASAGRRARRPRAPAPNRVVTIPNSAAES